MATTATNPILLQGKAQRDTQTGCQVLRQFISLIALLAVLLPGVVLTSPASANAAGASVALDLYPVADGFRQPVLLTHANDGSGRRFVVEQAGRILVLNADASRSLFIDLSDRVKNSGERGLLGLAFHPNFANNGRFFVYYTDRRGNIVIARLNTLASDPSKGDPASLKVLLTIANPASNHNGGMIAFGPDGYLYIGTGDGGGAGDPFQAAQNSYSRLGKLLRIDVNGASGDRSYRIPKDNPFAGRTTYYPEIWAYGLRNPWRFSFDRQTGDLFIADVGQDDWEEVNFQAAGAKGGADYGWSHMEGRHCFPTSKKRRCARGQMPVAEYGHEKGCSVVGGYVYRGTAIASLVGTYLFSDYCSGTVWGLTPRKGQPNSFRMKRIMETDLNVSAFGEDESGELYMMDHRKGGLYRVVPLGWTPPTSDDEDDEIAD